MTGRGACCRGRMARHELATSGVRIAAFGVDVHGRSRDRQTVRPRSLEPDLIEKRCAVADEKLTWARQRREGELW